VPGSPNSQSTKPNILDGDYVRLIPTGEFRSSTPEASSTPYDTMDAMDISNDRAHDTASPRVASVQLDEALSQPIQQQANTVEAEDDPFKLMGSDSKVAPGAVDDDVRSDGGRDGRTSDQ
jgi:hypothetical protein